MPKLEWDDLRPCPFCGKTDALTLDTLGDPDDWFVECDRCRLGTHAVWQGQEAAISAWNRRAEPDDRIARLEQENKALLEALREIVSVASGEKQVAFDDTEGMGWVDKRARAALKATEKK